MREHETGDSEAAAGDAAAARAVLAPAAGAAALPALRPTAAVMRLQAAAGNRATSRLLARNELPNSLDGSGAHQSEWNWTTADREGNTDKWKKACEYNLVHLRTGDFRHIAERRDFYKWFYEATAARGYETRWALAAYIVAGGMAEMSDVDWSEGLSPITNELQGLARIGNQVIFDDVLPKLKRIWEGPVLKGADARRSDQLVLAEEQNLIQNLYSGLSSETMKRFEGMANMTFTRAQIGQFFGMGGHVKAGTYNTGGEVPTFSSLVPGGDIKTPADRWRYGMELAKKMSTLPDYGKLDPMPSVGADYSGDAQFKRLNVRPHIHRIDAMLNDTDIPEDDVVKQLKDLNQLEQEEIWLDSWRWVRLGNALSYAEMKDAIADLPHLRVGAKFGLLDGALVRSWTSVDYSEVQPMIKLAAKHHPDHLTSLHTDAWKKVFLDICDDDTIETAVSDLQLPAAKAQEWVSAEKSVL